MVRVITVEHAYKMVVRDREAHRWFLRSDVDSWPQRAWLSAAARGEWSVIADDDHVMFGVRVADAYVRCIEISLARPTTDCYEQAVQYAGDFWNAATTICWLPADLYRQHFESSAPPAAVIPGYYDTGDGNDAVVLASRREDERAYLSLS